jgi:hypothetical protein
MRHRDDDHPSQPADDTPQCAGRRTFLGTAIAGAAGVGISSALVDRAMATSGDYRIYFERIARAPTRSRRR